MLRMCQTLAVNVQTLQENKSKIMCSENVRQFNFKGVDPMTFFSLARKILKARKVDQKLKII